MYIPTESTAQATACRDSEAKPDQPTDAGTILLVEDEAFVREVTCEVLRSAGYRVLPVKSAAEAVHSYNVSSGEVDLLLTDVVLPDETGPSLADRLRLRNSSLRVLFVTGYPDHASQLQAAQNALLAKPFSTGALLQNVKQTLERPEPRAACLATPACGSESPA